jgi:hypothetical protein
MKLKDSRTKLLLILLFFTMLLTTKLTVVSQVISTDSLKCFTYEQARQIITDLQQLPIKDSIIHRLNSVVKIDSAIINNHEIVIEKQGRELIDKRVKILRMKKNRKLLIIFGAILGVSTQLLF